MAKRPWMPLYVGDYLADTMHLSATESGAYLHLLMAYWDRGEALPNDDRWLCRTAKVHPPHWPRVRGILEPFFEIIEENASLSNTKTRGSWYHQRVESELSKVAEISNKRKEAAEQMHSKSSANAEQMHTHSHSHSQSKKESLSCDPVGMRTSAEEAFKEFWATYPKREGANPKAPAKQKFANVVKAGADPKEIVAAAGRYADELKREGKEAKFVAQAVTWINQKRWEDYPSLAANGGVVIPADVPPELHEDAMNGWHKGLPTSAEIIAKQKERENAKARTGFSDSEPPNGGEVLRNGSEVFGDVGGKIVRNIPIPKLRRI